MGIHFTWDTQLEDVARYTAHDPWDWKEFHRVVRVSTFSFYKAKRLVDSIVDFRGTTLPAGAVGHIRSIGRKQNEFMSGRAVVIGLDAATVQQIGAVDGIFRTGEQSIAFADDNDEAYQIMQLWRKG